jgi:hypothetical protein
MSGPWIVSLTAAIALAIVLIAAKFPNWFDKAYALTSKIFLWCVLAILGLAVLYDAVQFAWPAQWVYVIDPTWHVERGTMILDAFTLSNSTPYELKDFIIGCDAKGNSDTIIATPQATLYDVLKKGEKAKFSSLRLDGKYPDQAAYASCRVTYAHRAW